MQNKVFYYLEKFHLGGKMGVRDGQFNEDIFLGYFPIQRLL